MRPIFLNVDLEVRAGFDLTPFAEAFGKRIFVSYCGSEGAGFLAAFEISGNNSGPEKTLSKFCDVIEALPAGRMKLWHKATSRTFDIGFESGTERPPRAADITCGTLARIVALGATLAITVYPVQS